MKTTDKKELIWEIFAEGSGLNVYKYCQPLKKTPTNACRYFWSLSAMGLEDDEPGISIHGKTSFDSFEEVTQDVLKRYPEIFMLYCHYVHPNYKQQVANIIKTKIYEGSLNTSEMYSLESWLEQLNLTREELLDINNKKAKNEVPSTKFFTGYCPQCQLNHIYTDMKLNRADLWECEKDGLQIADNNFFAVILRSRGKQHFKKPDLYASQTVSGNSVLVEADESGFYPTNNIFNLNKELIKYLNEKVEPSKK